MLCLVVCLEFLGSGPLFHHDHLWTTLKPCYEDWVAHLFFFSNTRDIDKTVRGRGGGGRARIII